MNWGLLLGAVGWSVLGLLVLSIAAAVIAGAVKSARAVRKFTVAMDMPELFGYGGRVTANFETQSQVIEFSQHWMTDMVRWAESPDRRKGER